MSVATQNTGAHGGRLLLQRISTTMFAALTVCRKSYGDHNAGFECPHTHAHMHIVTNEALVSGSRTCIVPLPIQSIAQLEEVAAFLLARTFFTKPEHDQFLLNERKMALRHHLSASESGLKLGSGYGILINPIAINAPAPD